MILILIFFSKLIINHFNELNCVMKIVRRRILCLQFFRITNSNLASATKDAKQKEQLSAFRYFSANKLRVSGSRNFDGKSTYDESSLWFLIII